jgi:hypothetical protein
MARHESIPFDTILCELSAIFVAENGERVPLPALLRYDPVDPMAVTLVMWVAPDRMVEWTFARQLLADGAHQATGEGDVRIRPAFHGGRRVLGICLSSPAGHADLELPHSRVGTFIRNTYAAVPGGMEGDIIDWDTEFGTLLGPSPA